MKKSIQEAGVRQVALGAGVCNLRQSHLEPVGQTSHDPLKVDTLYSIT